jgi:hypothetical protein
MYIAQEFTQFPGGRQAQARVVTLRKHSILPTGGTGGN